jgi:hypothetical protein
MTTSEDPIAAYLNQAALLLDLPVHPEHYAEVLAAFLVLRAQAEVITEFKLPGDTEAAPRFTP